MPELDDIEEKSNGRRWRKYSRIDIDREINNNRDSREFEKIRYHHQFKRNKKVLWSSKYFIPISIPNYLNPPTRHPPLLIPRYPIDHGRPQFDLLFNFNYSSSIRARFKRKHRPFSSLPPSPLSPYRTLFPATHMRNTVLARITVACPDKPTTPYNCPSLSSVYRSPTIIVTISFRIIQPNGQWLYRRKLLPRSTWTHAPPPLQPLRNRVAFVPVRTKRLLHRTQATPFAKFPFGTCFAHIEIPFNRNFEWAARSPLPLPAPCPSPATNLAFARSDEEGRRGKKMGSGLEIYSRWIAQDCSKGTVFRGWC